MIQFSGVDFIFYVACVSGGLGHPLLWGVQAMRVWDTDREVLCGFEDSFRSKKIGGPLSAAVDDYSVR